MTDRSKAKPSIPTAVMTQAAAIIAAGLRRAAVTQRPKVAVFAQSDNSNDQAPAC